jgi:hypothetical protein
MKFINLSCLAEIILVLFFLSLGDTCYGQNKHILCVSAHPDDAESGCGGH